MSGPVNPQTLSPAFQQTRHARRIYVGGIPPNYADEEALKYFLNSVIAKGMGVENDNSYILSMYINQKKCFAFVELRAIELATACLDLDGIIYKKVILKVLRANEYKPELIPPSLLGKPIVFDLTSFAFGSPLANNLGMMSQGMGSYSTEEYSYGQQGQGQGMKEYQQQPQQIDFKQDAFSPKAGEQGRQEKNKELQPELKFDSIIHSLPIGQIIPNSLVLIGLPNVSAPAEETEKLKRTPPPFGSIAGTPNNASSRDLTARSLSVETAGQGGLNGGLNHALKITTTLSASKVLRNVLRKTKFGSLSNPEFDTTLTEARISDIGDVPQGATPDDLKQNLSNMVSEALIHGGTPFVVGGSCEDVTHSSALGLLNVVSSEQPVSLVTVSAQLGDNRILADSRFQEFKASVSSAAGEDTNNSINNSNNDTSPLNGMHNPDQQISLETEDNNNINNIHNNNNIDDIASGTAQANALPSKYVRFAAQGSQCTIETANFVTEKGGKIVWLTKDIRCGREIADWPAVPEENSKKFLSHACKLFEQALIYAAGNRENSNDNSSVNIDGGEATSPLTPLNRNTTTTTTTTSTNNAENTTTENGSTIVSVPAVHSQSNDSIAEEFRSQLGPQEGVNDDQQNTINNNTINNTNNSNTITMFPIVVTIDMNVLQQIDKSNNNSNSSTNSSVLGLTLDEVLDMARIAGANEHVAVFAVTDYTPDTDDTNSKGNLVLAEILYRFSLGVASRNSDSGNNSNNYTMSNVVMEHSASHGSLGYESSNSNSSLDLLAAAAVHHHNNSSGNNSTSNSNSSSNYNLKKLFHYAYQPNTITNNYNSLHNISMDSVYNTVNYAQQSTPTNANRMNNNSEHENMFHNNSNNNNNNNKHIVHMSAGGTGNNNNSSSYNMNSDYYQSHLSQQPQQQQQYNNKHQPVHNNRQSQNTHNMLSRQLSMGQMSMTNPAAPPTPQQQNYGSTISPTHYQQQMSLQQQNQQNHQNSQRFETSTVTTNAININAYAKPFTPPPDITQLNLPQPGSGERNRGSSYGNSSNNSSNYNLNIGISNGISSSHSHSSHGSALNSHVNSHNSSHSNLHTSLNNSNNINNSSISNLNNALLHQQIPTLNHNNALHGRSMSDNTMGSLVHHSNITLRHQNSNFNIHQNNHSSSQYAILQQLQTQAQQQADLLQHNSYGNNNNSSNNSHNNNSSSQHNRTLSPMSPLHGSMGRSVHNIVPSQQPISPPPQKSFHQSSLSHTMQHNTQQNNNSNNSNNNGNNSNNSQQTPSISPVNSSRSLLSVQSFPLTMPQSSFSLSQQQQVQMLSQRDNSTSNLRSLGSTISLQNTPRDHNLMRQHSDHPGGSMFTFTEDNTRGAQQPPQNYSNSNNSNKNGNNNNTNSTYIDYSMNNNNNNNKQQHGEVNYAGLSSLNLRDRENKVNAANNQHNQQHKHNALYRTNSNLSTISMSEIHEFDESLDLFGDLPPPPTAGRSRGQSIGQSVQHQHQQQQQNNQLQNLNTNQHTANNNNSNNQSGYNNNNNNNSYISGSSPAASSVASSVANGDMVWSLN